MNPLTSLGLALSTSAVLAATTLAATPSSAAKKITASLTGPAETKKGDPDGKGSATVTINAARTRVCYTLSVTGIAKATAAHIHKAAAGKDGPPVLPLKAPSTGSSHDCVAVEAALGKNLAADPDDYYVNVHNADYPAGAIRGQLKK
jgi:hypothetical protein